MDIKQIRAFLTVAETGNVTRAAELLHIVQPAVSKQLSMLEEDVGTKLFHRGRHGMTLTEAGRALIGYAQRAMLELDRARAELSGSNSEVAGIVTVGLLPSTIEVLSNSLIAAVEAEFPRIRIRIVVAYIGTLEQWLESGEIDIALLYGVEHDPHENNAKSLISEPLWMIGPASERLNQRRSVTLDFLEGKSIILANGSRGVRMLIDRYCAVTNVALHVKVETNSIFVQKSLVLGGHGFTIGPPISFADELAKGLLTGTPIDEPGFTRTIGIALPSKRAVSRPVSNVERILTKCMKESVENRQWPEASWLAN